MADCCPTMNQIGDKLIDAYNSYRKECDLLAQYIMAECYGYVVYVVEEDKDIFHIHFCHEDRQNDKTLIVRKEQLSCIHKILKDFLPNLC